MRETTFVLLSKILIFVLEKVKILRFYLTKYPVYQK